MIDPSATNLSFLPLKFSRNKLSHTIEAADPALASRVGLKYYLSLFVPEFAFSSNYQELHTSEGREVPVSSQSGVQVFAGAEFRYNTGRNGKIDGLLFYLKPRWQQKTMSLSLSQTTSYYLREAISGGEPAVDVSLDLAKTYAIKAGLSNEDFYAYGDNFFKSWQAENRQFLSWQPDYKTVSYAQEEYLYFLLNFTPMPTEVCLRLRCFYADGSFSDPVTVMSLSNPLLCSVVCCPVGAGVLQVDPLAVSYEVWLSNENGWRFSATRTFLIDFNYQLADRCILFVNSLGGWDTLRLLGEGSRTLKVAQTVAEVERTASASTDFSELKIISIEGEYEIQVSTGYFRRDAAQYLRYLDELLLSDEMYLITDKGHRPLQLTTNSLLDTLDNADLIARSFSFRILDTVENYSELPASEPTSQRATRWRGLTLKHVLDGYGKRTGKLVFERLEKVYLDDNSLVKPYTVKANVQGDPDYQPPISDGSIIAGSTPYPNVLIERLGSFKRSTCEAGYLGGEATVLVPAGKYGGETPGSSDALAEAEFVSLNTQGYADEFGSCAVNNVPVYVGLFHKIPMEFSQKVIGSSDYGPVVDVRISGSEIITNTTGLNPPATRLSESTILPGTFNILCEVEYSGSPNRGCKLRIPSKSWEINVSSAGFYLFDNVQVYSTDAPLTIEVTNL